jgi:hypothetical protein
VSKKLNIEFIRAEFAKENYILLTIVYDNAHQKLEYICPRGHKHSTSWTNWQQNQRCPCFSKYNNKPTIESIRVDFAKKGYELLTKVYKNRYQKLKYICPIGHRHSISWGNWQQGRGCPCFSNNIKLNIEFIRAEFAKEGYILLTKVYKNSRQKLKYICSGPERHKHSTSWGNWIQGSRCPFCNSNNNISKWEKTIKKFLDQLDVDYVSNDRTQLVNPKTGYNLELDIWFPQLNRAIECNGIYWHSKPERKECDKIKQQLCKDQGIDLLVITDEEWTDVQEKCKADILLFLETDNKLKQFRSVQ